jgi:hypothetical protein
MRGAKQPLPQYVFIARCSIKKKSTGKTLPLYAEDRKLLRTCGKLLDLRGRKWQEAGERCVARSFINLYDSPDVIRVIKSRRMRWVGRVARIGAMRNAHNILFRKPEGKRPFGRPRGRWENNIRMDLREMWWKVADWRHLVRIGTSGGVL